jgi:hypothetical protein
MDEVNVRASKAQCAVVLLEAQIEELQVHHEEEMADVREESAAALQEVCNLLASLDHASAETLRWKQVAQHYEREKEEILLEREESKHEEQILELQRQLKIQAQNNQQRVDALNSAVHLAADAARTSNNSVKQLQAQLEGFHSRWREQQVQLSHITQREVVCQRSTGLAVLSVLSSQARERRMKIRRCFNLLRTQMSTKHQDGCSRIPSECYCGDDIGAPGSPARAPASDNQHEALSMSVVKARVEDVHRREVETLKKSLEQAHCALNTSRKKEVATRQSLLETAKALHTARAPETLNTTSDDGTAAILQGVTLSEVEQEDGAMEGTDDSAENGRLEGEVGVHATVTALQQQLQRAKMVEQEQAARQSEYLKVVMAAHQRVTSLEKGMKEKDKEVQERTREVQEVQEAKEEAVVAEGVLERKVRALEAQLEEAKDSNKELLKKANQAGIEAPASKAPKASKGATSVAPRGGKHKVLQLKLRSTNGNTKSTNNGPSSPTPHYPPRQTGMLSSNQNDENSENDASNVWTDDACVSEGDTTVMALSREAATMAESHSAASPYSPNTRTVLRMMHQEQLSQQQQQRQRQRQQRQQHEDERGTSGGGRSKLFVEQEMPCTTPAGSAGEEAFYKAAGVGWEYQQQKQNKKMQQQQQAQLGANQAATAAAATAAAATSASAGGRWRDALAQTFSRTASKKNTEVAGWLFGSHAPGATAVTDITTDAVAHVR